MDNSYLDYDGLKKPLNLIGPSLKDQEKGKKKAPHYETPIEKMKP